jgi:hypothetical protein
VDTIRPGVVPRAAVGGGGGGGVDIGERRRASEVLIASRRENQLSHSLDSTDLVDFVPLSRSATHQPLVFLEAAYMPEADHPAYIVPTPEPSNVYQIATDCHDRPWPGLRFGCHPPDGPDYKSV